MFFESPFSFIKNARRIRRMTRARKMLQVAKALPLHQDQAHPHLIRLQARAVLLVQHRTLSRSNLLPRERELCI